MIEIEINNLTTNFFDEEVIKKSILYVLSLENNKNLIPYGIGKNLDSFGNKNLISSKPHFFASQKLKECSISVVIVGPETIKKLNKKYRGKNKTTDVLSFAVKNDINKISEFVDPTNNLGEVIVCPKYIKKNIKRENKINKNNSNEFTKKFLQTLIHGVLHLLGYDHKKIKEAQKMSEKEKFFEKNFFKNLKFIEKIDT